MLLSTRSPRLPGGFLLARTTRIMLVVVISFSLVAAIGEYVLLRLGIPVDHDPGSVFLLGRVPGTLRRAASER
jgi:hypothetical protein